MSLTSLADFNGGTIPTTLVNQFTKAIREMQPLYAEKATDNTPVNGSTTLVNDSDLFWALAANAKYQFTIPILYNANTTANFKYAFTFPAGARLDFGALSFQLGGSNNLDDRAFVNYTSGTAISTSGSSADTHLLINGKIAVGGTAGTLQFQFAQNTINASNTVTKAGSSGTLRQVA